MQENEYKENHLTQIKNNLNVTQPTSLKVSWVIAF